LFRPRKFLDTAFLVHGELAARTRLGGYTRCEGSGGGSES
jgi:hypothetical protein